MLRILYALAVATLLGGSAITAPQMDWDSRPERGAAIMVLAALPH
jgi:hypothetical protein